MKIFISYGHNDHVNLVNAVYDALKAAGHEPWKDDQLENGGGIAAGENFAEVIQKKIDESDFVVAFITAVTTDRSFCCDEREYANKKDKRFIQIRLDNMEIFRGCSRSYIDMSDVEESDGRINQKLFEEKMGFLFAAFRDPDSFAEGGFTPWTKFEAHLKVPGVMKYSEFITMPDREDFVGREWLCEKCRSWVMDDSIACRLFVILGEAGTGKTAFIRHLAKDRSLVRSVHVCIYDRPSTRTAKDTLKDLAYILAGNNDSYFNFLKNKSFDKIEDMNIDGMFEFLFLEPLKNEREKYLIIIDGLDELDEVNGLRPLMKLFRQYAEKINPNISFLVTGRPDESITDKLRTVRTGKPVEKVVLDSESGKKDLEKYAAARLRELGCFSETLFSRIMEACDGNFEYLSLLFKEAKEEGLLLTEDTEMPKGLYSRYSQYIDRRLEAEGQDLRLTKAQRLLLSVMCVAFEPLPLSLLADFADMEDEYDAEQELKIFGSLIRKAYGAEGELYVSFFAKGFRDYLLERDAGNYRADYRLGTKTIAEYIMKNCRSRKAFLRNPYIDRNGFRHLLAYAEREDERVKEFSYRLWEESSDTASLKIAMAVSQGDGKIARMFCEMFAEDYGRYREVITHLKSRRDMVTLNKIADTLDEMGIKCTSLTLRGDILLRDPSPERITETEKLYHQAREIRERKYTDNPCFETREKLAIICDRLGNAIKAKGTSEGKQEAEQWYKKACMYDEQNYEERPCYESRRGFAVSCRRLGDMSKEKSTPEGLAEAEKWYRKEFELEKKNYLSVSCNESRWALAIACINLGDTAKAKNTPEDRAEAERLYKEAADLFSQNHDSNPCHESRRELANAYERLGNMRAAEKTAEGLREAEAWYRKTAGLFIQNYKDNPCYESRHNLAVAYERLADLSKAENTAEGLSEAEELVRKALELMVQNYSDNPCYESRRTLGVAYYNLGNIIKLKNTPEGLCEAEEWYIKASGFLEQNYRENICYESRRNLIVIYEKMGDAARMKCTPEGLCEAERLYRKILELAELSYSSNPCHESRRGLALTCKRLGIVAAAQGKTDEAEEWYSRQQSLINE